MITMAAALNAGLRRAMEKDPNVVLLGEDIGTLGGVFRVTDTLAKDFGPNRVIDTPLAESAIVGTAFGMALRGLRPVCEIQFDGFVYPAFDQIVSQVAKIRNRTHGRVRVPMTIRIPFGGGIGAVEHHSESPEAYFAHTAGLRVVSPSNPVDAFHMIQQAIALDDPVIFFEPKRRYWDKAEVDLDAPAPLGLHDARVARVGDDVTLIAYGPTVGTALTAAQIAAGEGTSIEVVDLRTLSPLDLTTVLNSVRKTGRAVITHEASTFAGLGAEIAAQIGQECFAELRAPVLRVGGFNVPYPPAKLEHHHLPDPDRILGAVDQVLDWGTPAGSRVLLGGVS